MIIEKELKTNKTEEFIEITKLISDELKKCNIEEGLLNIFIPHTTAGITINENADPDVRKDLIKGLSFLGFDKVKFDHVEGNSPAHLKTLLTGSSVQVMVKNNQMILGTWQGIYFCEYDGPRTRKVLIQTLLAK